MSQRRRDCRVLLVPACLAVGLAGWGRVIHGAAADIREARVSVQWQERPYCEALRELSSLAGARLVAGVPAPEPDVTFAATDAPPKEVLAAFAEQTGTHWRNVDGVVVILQRGPRRRFTYGAETLQEGRFRAFRSFVEALPDAQRRALLEFRALSVDALAHEPRAALTALLATTGIPPAEPDREAPALRAVSLQWWPMVAFYAGPRAEQAVLSRELRGPIIGPAGAWLLPVEGQGEEIGILADPYWSAPMPIAQPTEVGAASTLECGVPLAWEREPALEPLSGSEVLIEAPARVSLQKLCERVAAAAGRDVVVDPWLGEVPLLIGQGRYEAPRLLGLGLWAASAEARMVNDAILVSAAAEKEPAKSGVIRMHPRRRLSGPRDTALSRELGELLDGVPAWEDLRPFGVPAPARAFRTWERAPWPGVPEPIQKWARELYEEERRALADLPPGAPIPPVWDQIKLPELELASCYVVAVTDYMVWRFDEPPLGSPFQPGQRVFNIARRRSVQVW
jgi:hypothetical protein